MAKLRVSLFIISLMFCIIGTINSAVTTGYFYDNPIRPFNPTSFSSVRSTGQYSSIPYGQKVDSSTRQTRLKLPPIPSLPPLTTYIPKQTTRYESQVYGRVQSTTSPTIFNGRPIQQQTQQRYQQQQQQQTTQFQRPSQQQQQQQQQKVQIQQTYSYPKPQAPVNTQFFTNNQQTSYPTITQQRNIIPLTTIRTPTQFYQTTTQPTFNIQRQTPKPQTQQQQQQQLTSSAVVPQQQVVSTSSVVKIPTTASVINTQSNPSSQTSSAGLLASPEIYVVDGRQLKQYKVYEHIDNDIDQEVHNFLPADFFLNTYHSMIGDTHPLGEDVQVQSRPPSFQQRSQQIRQQTPNTVALGSGGLGFVKLPNGNVYLGSGSLGYISSLQHSQDIQDLRSRSSLSAPDALHFGHGPLSDSFYYRNQKD